MIKVSAIRMKVRFYWVTSREFCRSLLVCARLLSCGLGLPCRLNDLLLCGSLVLGWETFISGQEVVYLFVYYDYCVSSLITVDINGFHLF